MINQTACFECALEYVLGHEGGYENNPNDSGGTTKYGISERFLEQNHITTKINDITPEIASELYFKYFWKPNLIWKINSCLIAAKVFDICVNVGPKEATIIVQRAINNFNPNAVVIDGTTGELTIKYINIFSSPDDEILYKRICVQLEAFYENLVKENQILLPFLAGWKNRAASRPKCDSSTD